MGIILVALVKKKEMRPNVGIERQSKKNDATWRPENLDCVLSPQAYLL